MLKVLNVEDFAQAIKDVLDRKETAISHNEAREIVNKYFEELETKLNAENIEKGKSFLEETQKDRESWHFPVAYSTKWLQKVTEKNRVQPTV